MAEKIGSGGKLNALLSVFGQFGPLHGAKAGRPKCAYRLNRATQQSPHLTNQNWLSLFKIVLFFLLY